MLPETPLRQIRSAAGDGRAWALIDLPLQPSLVDANPDAMDWRDLRLDPDLAGLAADGPRPARIRLWHDVADHPWEVPVSDVLNPYLAWCPRASLVAGLTVQGRRAKVWVADYAARTVTVDTRTRVAVGFLAEGGRQMPAVAWLDEKRLAVLIPAPALPVVSPPGVAEPVVCEAAGPGFVAFEAGPAELAAAAATRLAVLDLDTGTATPLTPPLLIRTMRPAPSGRAVLLENAPLDQVPPAWRISLMHVQAGAALQPLPAGARWAGGAEDVLTWRTETKVYFAPQAGAGPEQVVAVPGGRGPWWAAWHQGRTAVLSRTGADLLLTTDGRPGVLVPMPAGIRFAPASPIWTGDTLTLACRDRHGREGIATLDADRTRFNVRWEYQPPAEHSPAAEPKGGITLGTGYADALLTLHPGPAGEDLPVLLWLDSARAGEGSDDAAVAPTAGPEHHTATLHLPLHWPSDADVAMLRRQIVEPVRAAYDILRERHAGPIVVGGHSFGATLALYALAELPSLAAAIVHSGCYNRTSTPTGFQYERRSYWDVPAVYEAFSALAFADRLTRPVLIAHGARDPHPATTPDQAVELYRAIVATGGRARLVLLPEERHTFRYRENLEFLAGEARTWLASARQTVEV